MTMVEEVKEERKRKAVAGSKKKRISKPGGGLTTRLGLRGPVRDRVTARLPVRF